MKTQLSKPARDRARYSEEYKKEALELWRNSGRSAAKVAAELGIRAPLLYRWARPKRQANHSAHESRSGRSVEELEASGQIGFKSKYSAFDWDSKTPTVWLGHCGWNMKMRSITFASEGTRGSGSFTIGELFGGPDYAVVAQRICRARSAHNAGERSQLIKEMLNVRFDPNFSWMATTFHPLFGLNAALTG